MRGTRDEFEGGSSRGKAESRPLRPTATASATAGIARGVIRIGIALVAALDAILVLRVIESGCRLSQPLETDATTLVPRIGAWSGVAADAGLAAAPSVLAALAALSLASLLVIVRGASPRATATVALLALTAAFLASPGAVFGVFGPGGAAILAIAFRTVIAVLLAVLAWRWIEELALAAALAPRVDPHAIDATTDREASEDAIRGPGARDGAARRLDEVLSERVVSASVASSRESGMLGTGSPIPPSAGVG
jgi:hypothetical protein